MKRRLILYTRLGSLAYRPASSQYRCSTREPIRISEKQRFIKLKNEIYVVMIIILLSMPRNDSMYL